MGTSGKLLVTWLSGRVLRVVVMARKRVLAIASAGGHWEQLMRMRSAFAAHDTIYVTTKAGLGKRAGVIPRVVPDCNRDEVFKILRCVFALARLMVVERPSVVISTGALPGFFAVVLGRMMGARTLWIDSIANGEELSLSGEKARRFAHVTASQWPSVAREQGVEYWGAVL